MRCNNVYSGAGPIGLTTLLSARAAGAEPIVITDLFQNRLDFAKKLVPGVRTLLISPNATSKEQAAQVKEAAGGPLLIALECTGVEGSIHTAIYVSCSSSQIIFKNFFQQWYCQVYAIWWKSFHHWCWKK
jgi:threonine dehydrogenase-like Zn-dependent dehydrogenase